MKTVKELKQELNNFDDDAICYAYEGEVIGIVIEKNDKQGFIYCSEQEDVKATEVI